MTRPSFKLGDVITGEPHLYVANPPAPPTDSSAEPPPNELKEAGPFKRFAAWCMFIVGHGSLAAAFGKVLRP